MKKLAIARTVLFALLLMASVFVFCSCQNLCVCSTQEAKNTNKGSIVRIEKAEKGYQLIRNGEEYFINGAGGSRYLDTLVEYGGNSVRSWSSSQRVLDAAEKHGLSVCLGLRLKKPRKGFDYTDQAEIRKQFERIKQKVLKYKDHPALLMWGIGNEPEHHATKEQRIRIWKAVNDIAAMIKEVDGNHPVITVTAGTGRSKLRELNEYCPELDAVGINSYGKLPQVPEQIKQQGWERPYLVTEFGPRGWWEVEKTSWGIPIEDTSSEKAEFYGKAYRRGIKGSDKCLGSYVFLWGNKQEKTHTWFNLFLPDGSPTNAVDMISRAWTGKWPANRAPAIGSGKVTVVSEETKSSGGHIFKTNTNLLCKVDVTDPDGDEITVKWDIRIEGATNKSTGGDHEPATKPIEGLVLSTDGKTAVIKTPGEEGMYRIFVYVYDEDGSAGTANVPILVKN